MDKYIVVITLCDKKEVAEKIINSLLEKRLIAGSQTTVVHSKWWWNNEIEECDEYKLEFRTKQSLFDKIKDEIKLLHDYETPEISYYEIQNGSEEFLRWIDKEVK